MKAQRVSPAVQLWVVDWRWGVRATPDKVGVKAEPSAIGTLVKIMKPAR